LGELTPEAASNKPSGDSGGGGGGQLGLSVRPITADEASQLGMDRNTRGVVVASVDPAGPAAEAGIQPGDVIVEANRQPVRSAEDLRSALGKSGSRPALLLLNRGGKSAYVTVRPQ
jgi:S1-C subfamily serine protease